ncbi:MAG: NifB/NifX family molybdenum-iron cluster-binding protein [Clostridia bacterium]|nr:NifB/NifX family molybdenum-iron cluster-binding protein [Clostridia bacterium]
MRIAVTYENGEIFQHFGHTEQFKLYDVKEGTVIAEEIVATAGSGHGALASFLKEKGVCRLICGGIGGGAKDALKEAGIELYNGVSGNADEAVKALLAGTLVSDPNAECDHHAHGEHHGHHDCGEHGHHEHGHHGCGGHGHHGHGHHGHGHHGCGHGQKD